MANSKVLLSDLMYCRCFSTAEVRVRPGMSSDIKSGEQEQPVTIAEQTEKAFLKQPNVFLSLKKSGKGKWPGKGGNRFWKNIVSRCREQSLFAETISTSSRSIKDMRKDIPASLPMSHPASVSKKVTMSSLANAGHCQKTVRFNVLKVIPAFTSAFAKKAFTGM
ncbi:hypothetical protein F2Q68_00044524 [Brassica cretica]|uniref:Uncharacterized protein n=1 Tax=Brassica cretica TaxID=69181 RepID=A0A8S9LLV7_BRACR|nr:hypothetical protein F2Q68_00044524 [Brassica cretica]